MNNEEKLKELIEKSDKLLKNSDRKDGGTELSNDEMIEDNDYFKDSEGNDYDPDSSEVAWEYYKIMYEDTINIEASIERKDDKRKYRRERGYFEYEKKDNKIVIKQIPEKGELEIGKIHLAGDCVFNFNEDKLKEFEKFVEKDKLLYYNQMHHSPYNFVLMPTEGGMNGQKGFTEYDRADWFLCSLSKFYANLDDKIKKDIRDVEDGTKAWDISNKDGIEDQIFAMQKDEKNEDNKRQFMQKRGKYTCINLYHFLAQIETAKAYAKLFYHLTDNDKYDENGKDDKTLFEKMIELGENKITNSTDLETYMDLAIRYWKVQQGKYRNNIENQK